MDRKGEGAVVIELQGPQCPNLLLVIGLHFKWLAMLSIIYLLSVLRSIGAASSSQREVMCKDTSHCVARGSLVFSLARGNSIFTNGEWCSQNKN